MRRIVLPILFFLLFSLGLPKAVLALSECQQFSLEPVGPAHNAMPVYKGGETITITVFGSAETTSIDLFWKSAYLPMNQSSGWERIPGDYNASTRIFIANWQIPNDPQEIILAANSFGASGFCSGSPCSSACPGGAYWQYGGPAVCGPNPVSCCNGCQRKIVVDPLRDLNSSNAVDLKDYLKMDPGNYWEFHGINYTFTPAKEFNSRFEIEPPTLMCGHKAIAIRLLKDSPAGYCGAQRGDDPNWSGAYVFRFSLSDFNSDNKWSDRFSGAPWFSAYQMLAAPDQFKGLGTMTTANTGWLPGYETSGSQHFYYPPYLFAPRYLPNDQSTWHFKREDATFNFNFNTTNDACKFEDNPQYVNDYNTRDHGWETLVGWENITPNPAIPSIYTGRALKITFLEYNTPHGTTRAGGDFLIREDWLFAKDIGLVGIKTKDLRRKLGLNRDNCGSECDNNVMQNPEIEMRLTKYYTGTPITVSSPVFWVQPGGIWPIDFSQNYTGYIDFQADAYFNDGTTGHWGPTFWTGAWVQDGHYDAPIPNPLPIRYGLKQGKYIYQFRRHLPDLPEDKRPKGEILDPTFVNNLPWSNPIIVYFQDTNPFSPPLPGDLNRDGKVDILDLRQLLSSFTNIFDYNLVVGNFGK